MLIHREALELARNASVDGDGVPFTITCVHITPDGAVTATDGHHFLRMNAVANEPNLFDEIAEKGTEPLEAPVLIPADVVKAFNAAMKKRKSKKGMPVPHVVVAQKKDRITLASSDGKTVRTFLMEAIDPNLTFPDVDRVFRPVTRSVVLGVDLLSALLKTLKSCGATGVKLGFPEGEAEAISVSAHTETGLIDGAIMPMRE